MTPSKLTGKLIKEWRERLGWSQAETAEKLGISEGSWRNYEHEKRKDKEEPVQIPKLLDWALAALHGNLKPFSETFLSSKKSK